MRCFIAIDPPEEVQKYLFEVQDEFRDCVKASFPKSFHLTLMFLGEVQDIDKVVVELEKIKFRELELELNALGVFPKPNNSRVLWVGLKENEELVKLVKDVEDKLGKNDKPFNAHLTLARVKFLKEKEKFKEILKAELKKMKFKINTFILYKSTLTPEGPVYENIKVFSAKPL